MQATTKEYVDSQSSPASRGELVFSTSNHGFGQSVGAGSGSFLRWTSDFATYDPHSFFSDAEPTSITFTFPGIFWVSGSVCFPSMGGGTRTVRLDLTYEEIRGGSTTGPGVSGSDHRIGFSDIIVAPVAGDFIRVHSSASGNSSNPSYPGGASSSMISVHYVAPA